MAIFNKGNINPTSGSSSETTVISSGARMEGTFYFNSMLHVDGELNGIVHSENIVVIGRNGNVKGELQADKIVVNGYFEGELEANSLEILAGGYVSGNITIKELSIENGGKFNGSSKIKEDTVKLIETHVE
ncbi:polymer-forming cytoskeletal protein [Campylobacter sp. MIT 21-1685]|uniref:bactofilin family protein n=1 Tax=unclassified Campylobacter TaxID=2593542 RepID=UPI00224A8371|nr:MULTISPECIES: polymer-forming cytoskeletal protein [unclassified Campylobacter]MCX2682402.1 polymer-forming cytoskeletal protein [Campylobacter sp. MIT 21-1684]MCX2750682.1 polymer-forming cytoskeletal protein [Campylobacter sp. MIT 21-1682]MCX2806770.1 polymer-forming cytoskeletal protein [Campylobacter sp. MIT 21-1685]